LRTARRGSRVLKKPQDVGVAFHLVHFPLRGKYSRNPAPSFLPVDPVDPAVEPSQADDVGLVVPLQIVLEPIEIRADLIPVSRGRHLRPLSLIAWEALFQINFLRILGTPNNILRF
jgi:hypothetical protein